MTPLRQFKGVPKDIIRKAEAKQFVSAKLFINKFALTLHLSPGTVTLIWSVILWLIIVSNTFLNKRSLQS